MRNYILKILLKHPIGRTQAENITIERYVKSVALNNEDWIRELSFFSKIELLFDKHYQNVV